MRKILYIVALCIVSVSFPESAIALTVSPARVEITADPGTTYRGEIELFNEQEGTRTFYTTFENFEPDGESGAPRFIGAEDGLATWIGATDSVELASGGRAVVPYSITIPADAEAGGHFAAIFFGSQPAESQNAGEVAIGGKIGVLVLLSVAGDVEQGGGLLDFTTKDYKRFFSTLPVAFTYRINNTGGDRVVPTGSVTVRNSFWLKSAELLANEKGGSVLPQSARKFELMWGTQSNAVAATSSNNFFQAAAAQWSDFHFGWYTARLAVSWGNDSGQVATDSYHFFIIPWQLLLIVALVVLVFGSLFRIGMRRYNRFIIAQAMHSKR